VKIEVWDHKPSHKLGRIGVKPGTFQMNLLLISLMTVAYDPVKTPLSKMEAKAGQQTNHNARSQAF